MDNIMIITVLVFICAFLTVLGVYMIVRSNIERRTLLEKIKNDGVATTMVDTLPVAGEKSSITASLVSLSMWLGSFVKPKNEDEISRNRMLYVRAGYRHRNAPIIFQGMMILLALVLPVGFYVAQILFLHMRFTYALVLCILLALIGLNTPVWWLKMKISQRKQKITEGFPDALDLMVVCVEAGMGLDSAISRVACEMKEVNKPISEEFKLLNMELRAGRTRRDALKNLTARTDLEDVSTLVTLIIQTDRFGTSVGPALRVHSDSMRTKRYQRAEEIASKIPTKLIFPLLLFIFPSMFIIFLAPPIVQLSRMWKGLIGG